VGAVGVVGVLDELPPQPAISAPAATLAPEKKVRRDIFLSFEWFGPCFTGKTPIRVESTLIAFVVVVHRRNGRNAHLDSRLLLLSEPGLDVDQGSVQK
jgi:hypothetical protein